MWCKVCQNETENKVCNVCGTLTVSDVPMEIYYCSNCKIPIIRFTSELKKREKCSCCGKSNGRAKSPYCPNCGAKMDGDEDEAKIKELEEEK